MLWVIAYGDQSAKKGNSPLTDPAAVFDYVLTQVDNTKPKPIEITVRIADK